MAMRIAIRRPSKPASIVPAKPNRAVIAAISIAVLIIVEPLFQQTGIQI
jgi:hypothetical protein